MIDFPSIDVGNGSYPLTVGLGPKPLESHNYGSRPTNIPTVKIGGSLLDRSTALAVAAYIKAIAESLT